MTHLSVIEVIMRHDCLLQLTVPGGRAAVSVYDVVINRLSHRIKIDHMKADDPRDPGNPFIKMTS